MPLHVIEKDITTLNVDAVVNSTNELLVGVSGVDMKINDIGGIDLEKACDPLRNTCFLGESTYTDAFYMNAKIQYFTL